MIMLREPLIPGSIAQNGYSVGELLSLFTYPEEKPGLGLWLALSLVAGLWLWYVKGIKSAGKITVLYTIAALLLTLASLHFFPWDLLQRIHPVCLKLISMLRTPAVFYALAQIALCIPGACSVGALCLHFQKRLIY